ncbi:unnamed protein product, partial [Pneumocystis jirovecii]
MALRSISVDFSGISSLAASGDRLLAGSTDGSLYDLYVAPEQQAEEEDNMQKEGLPLSFSAFFSVQIGKFIEQIVYIDEATLAVCLVDGQVVLYNVSLRRIEGVLPSESGIKGQETRNSSLNSAQETAYKISLISHMQMDGTMVSLLAIALKQRLVVYFWRDGILSTETVEIALNQRVRALTWINSTRIYLCFGSEYAFADLEAKCLTKPVSIKGFTTLLRSLGVSSTNINYIGLHTRSSKFLSVRISDHEFLLSYHLKSIFLDNNGHPLKRSPIIWDSEPTHLVYFHPHLIAAFDHQIRVHNIESYVLIQTFNIRNITCIFSGKYLFISTQTQIWKFLNIPFDTQTDKIRHIKMMKAYHLFNKRDYKNSMILYSESSASPIIVLSLFPLENIDYEQYANDASISTYIHNSKMFLKTMNKKLNQLIEISDYPDFDLKEATHALASYYLNDARRKLSILISSISQFQESFETLNEPLIPKYHFTLPNSDSALTLEEMEKLLEIVDTALFRAYMFVTPNLVGPLVRLQNKIQLSVAKDLLEKDRINVYRQIINIYRLGEGVISDSVHNEQFKGPSETINYLKKLNDNHIEEILLFIKWPLEINPDFAMEIFLNDNQQLSLSKKKVYDFLLSFNEDLAIKYLEYLINDLNNTIPEFHDSLIMHYLKNIQEKENSNLISKKLLKFLLDSEKYNLQYILEHLPKQDNFLEHKAIILSKLGKHKCALETYVFEMKDFKKVTEYIFFSFKKCSYLNVRYCTKIFSMNNSKLSNEIYLILLNLLLKPPSGQKIQLSYALDFLSQYRSQINIETIISELPLDIKISNLKLYLESTIQNRITNIINGKIIYSLQMANLAQYQNKLIDASNKKYTITPEKTCQNCHKRLGQSVLAIFP